MWRNFLVLIFCCGAVWGSALSATDDFNALRRAFAKDDIKTFTRVFPKINAKSPYYELARYWRAVLDLRRNRISALVDLHQDTVSRYIREQAGRKLADYYINKRMWENFVTVADISPCAQLLRNIIKKSASRDRAQALWADERNFRDSLCVAAYKRSKQNGLLSEEDVWIKLRSLAGDGKLAAARRLLKNFKLNIRYKDVRKVVRGSLRYIRGKHSLTTRARQELVMIAAVAAARKHPDTAIRRWRAFSRYFSGADNNYMWARMGQRAASAHRDDALALFRRAKSDIGYNNNTRAWRVRAALRAGDFYDALDTINRMSPAQASLSAWRYWKSVALRRAGNPRQADKAMRDLAADEDDYYGLLAQETISVTMSLPSQVNIKASVSGDFAMALAVYKIGDERLARKIWRHATELSPAATVLAAARAAEQAKWYLASINAADSVKTINSHALRYPMPYRQTIEKYRYSKQIEPAFAYALIRRESRFMPTAISSAKARGLMQILPSTAVRVARKHKYGRYRLSRLTRVDTNVIIGMTYLQDLSAQFKSHPVFVAAAYNAGPSRSARWRKNNAHVDILILIENIPFFETRLYVKALLANRLHYFLRLGKPLLISEVITRKMTTR